jgi:threonine synthase
MGKTNKQAKLIQKPYNGVLDRYWSQMPSEMQLIGKENIVTLCEGRTRLWRAHNIENYLNETYGNFKARIYLKLEGDNLGTHSFKDRGMTAAVTMAKARGKRLAICASTGNTAASASAYCKIAGIKLYVLLPDGSVASGKIFQSALFGANIIQIRGNFDAAMMIVKKICEASPDVEILNSLNAYRIHGQKTAAFEIVDDLGRAPRYHFIPVGNGMNIAAYWQGYKEYYEGQAVLGIPRRILQLPKMIGYQASGAAPLVLGHSIDKPYTRASAIKIGNPTKRDAANSAVKESRGMFDFVTDDEIEFAYKLIPELEGISCEFSSATSVAGLIRKVKTLHEYTKGPQAPFMTYAWYGCDIVCTLTGHIFKDLEFAQKTFIKEPIVIDASYDAVMDVIISK